MRASVEGSMASYLARPARCRATRVARLRGSQQNRDPQQLTKQARERKSQRERAAPTREPHSLRNPITMQQRQEIERDGTRRPGAVQRWLPAAVVALALVVVTDPLVATTRRVYNSLLRDQYALYRAHVEKLNLQAANARMLSELIALRSQRTKQGAAHESELTKKIAELESLIESVTALGVFHNHRTRQATSTASKGTNLKGTNGTLAAILASPQLAGPSATAEDDGKEGGVGGAEEPCDGDKHTSGAHKEDIALTVATDDLNVQLVAPSAVKAEYQGLVARINRCIAVMQFLPLGSPVQGRLTSGFGHRLSPFSHSGSFHYGVDISLKVGSKVVATGAGRVVKVTHNRAYGTMVDIQHAPGLVTRYAHLSKVHVHAGQDVTRGTVIALSGNSGRSTGPHLHYEVRHNGKARNPTPFVQLAGKLSEFLGSEGTLRS